MRALTTACLAVLILGFSVSSPSWGQRLTIDSVYLEELPEIHVVLEPGTPDGAAGWPTLDPSELVLLEDGQATSSASTVRPFAELGRGSAVVIVVDVSGTMAGDPLDELTRAMLAMSSQAGPRDRIALVSFADDVLVESSFEDSPEHLASKIEGLTARGQRTELYQAAYKAFDLFESAPADLPKRRRVLLISDGKNEGFGYGADDVLDRAEETGIRIDAIGLTRIEEQYLGILDQMSRRTGGVYRRADAPADLAEIIQRGSRRWNETPTATFTAERLVADGAEHRVGVRWTRGDDPVRIGEVAVVAPLPQETAEGGVSEDDPESADIDGTEGTEGTEGTDDPSTPETFWGLDPLWWILAACAVGLVLLLLVWWWLRSARRRRQRSAAAPPPASPAPPAHRPATPSSAEPDVVIAPHSGTPGVAPAPASERPKPPPPPPPAKAKAKEERDPPQSPTADRRDRKTRLRTPFAQPTPEAPSALLVGRGGSVDGARFEIDKSPLWLGAATGTDICLPDDEFLSSHHASIQFHRGSLLLHDNTSTNGTFVNGSRVGTTPRPLAEGDRIRVGRSTFELMKLEGRGP